MQSLLIFGRGFIAKSLIQYAPTTCDVTVVSPAASKTNTVFAKTTLVARAEDLDANRSYDVAVFCSGPATPSGVSPDAAVRCRADFTAALGASVNAKAFVYMSSGGAIYKPLEQPLCESDPLDHSNTYGVMHLANENQLESFLSIPRRVSFRLGNPFGIHQQPQRSVGFVKECFNCAFEDRTLRVAANGLPRRDFFHVKTVSNAVKWVSNAALTGFEIFNLASGVNHSLAEIVALVEHSTGKTIRRAPEVDTKDTRMTVSLSMSKFQNTAPSCDLVGAPAGIQLLSCELSAANFAS